MIDFAKISALKQSISELNFFEKFTLITGLMKEKVFDFNEMSRGYVKDLEDERRQIENDFAKLELNLCFFARTDESDQAKQLRKEAYQRGHFKGSDFGNELEKEFGIK